MNYITGKWLRIWYLSLEKKKIDQFLVNKQLIENNNFNHFCLIIYIFNDQLKKINIQLILKIRKYYVRLICSMKELD